MIILKWDTLFVNLQAKDNNQSVCIVAEKSTLKEYKKFSGRAKAESKEVAPEANNDPGDKIISTAASASEIEPDSVKGVVFAKTASSKEAIEKACELTFHHNLTICHVNIENDQVDGDSEATIEQSMNEEPQQRRY